MYCTQCGTQLPDDSRFCLNCGAALKPAEPKDTVSQGEYDNAVEEKPNVAQPTATQPTPAATGSAADDGILSILGFVFSFSAPLIGLILSMIGYNKPKYRNLAVAGIIIGSILLVTLLVIVAVGFSNMRNSDLPLFILITALL